MKNKVMAFAAMIIACGVSNAATVDFNYNFTDASPEGYGKNKAETIDVAIRLSEPSLVGKKVTRLYVPVFGNPTDMTDFQGFLTTELKTKNQNKVKVNDPDICSVPGEYADGILTVTFNEPYTITDKGVYVGYSLTVTGGEKESSGKPIAVVTGSFSDSFWFHTTSSVQKWNDYAIKYNLTSDMTVVVDGDFLNDAAFAVATKKVYAGIDSDAMANITITNQGINEIKSISYSYEAFGKHGAASYNFQEPIPGKLGYPVEIELPVGKYDALGEGELVIKIDEVNGGANKLVAASVSTPFDVIPFIPKNRPLVEEYTGLRCGWCPGGYVTLAEMNEKYGHDFVALSFHSMNFENPAYMVYLNTSDFPYDPSGYPSSQINRTFTVEVRDIPKRWTNIRETIPCGDVEVELNWVDEDMKVLEAVAKTRFINNIPDSPYLITFAVVADGLSNPEWAQFNAYADPTVDVEGLTGKWWDLFVHTDTDVYGLVFDDVVIHFPDVYGIEGSLPADIKLGEVYENSFSVNTDDILNLGGLNVVNDFGKARVVAMIIDTRSGAVVNCASSGYPGQSGIREICDEYESQSVIGYEYYDLTGRRVFNPSNGLYIKVDRLENGSLRTSKVIM